jgi:hypothetical protein
MNNIVEFTAILFTALALVPSGAHLMELPNKIALSGEQYRIVQQIYRGWALSGVLVVAALVTTTALSWTLRGQAGFTAALVAVLCIAGTQLVFWVFTYPVNVTTQNWAILPSHWEALRLRWEYSHAASAVLNMTALIAAIVAVLRSR